MSRTATGLLRRGGAVLLWFGLPTLALAAVAAYIVAAIALHVNPPVVPIQGVSMRPTLQTGELVFLEGVEPKQIRKGDIIAVNVPKEARQKYSLPSRVVHRVIKIEQTRTGPVFQTKGDGNPGPDVFTVPASEVVGRMAGHVPGLGYPLLFFRSTQGKILLGAIALIVLLYFLIGLFEERQATVQGTAVGLQAVLAQTEEIKRAMQGAPAAHAPAPSNPASAMGVGNPVGVAADPMPALATSPSMPRASPGPPGAGEPTVVVSAGRREENAEMLDRLLAAVGEYGEHLRSHTAVMQGLAQATKELRQATEELRRAAAGPPLPPPSPPPAKPSTHPAESSTPAAEPPLHSTPPLQPFAEPPLHAAQPPSPTAETPPHPLKPSGPTAEPSARPAASAVSQIEPRVLLLLAVGATATAVYLRRRLRRMR